VTLPARAEVEDLLYREARLLDARDYKAWEQLFTADACYLVPPLGIDHPERADPANMLFIVADDRLRLSQRVIRLLKPSAHAEYPPSRLRHLVSNVEVLGAGASGRIQVTASFVVYRVRNQEIGTYMGQYWYQLQCTDVGLRIAEKRACLDLDALMPQGALAFIL
jgi:p-cumate 2,3-dioxygenase beta subunit